MSPANIELHLLRVFMSLLRERSVTGAAERLGMSQPAVSHALRRLREALGDDLFLRTRQGMEPTAHAQALADPISQALDALDTALRTPTPFVPAKAERRFTLALSDIGELYFLPRLTQALSARAPGVQLQVRSVADEGLREAMRSGQVDLALGLLPQLQGGFYQQLLFRQSYVVLHRAVHPLAGRARLRQADLQAAQYARVDAGGTGHGQVHQALARSGWALREALCVPHYTALGPVLAQTELIAIVPQRFAEAVAPAYGLAARRLPLDLPAADIHQLWHARVHRDPGHRWLRALVAELFACQSARAHALPTIDAPHSATTHAPL